MDCINSEGAPFSHSAKQRTAPWIGAGITYSSPAAKAVSKVAWTVSSERTVRLVVETNTKNVPNNSQTRSCHESIRFNVGDETLRDRTEQPVVNHDDSSHEQTLLNEANMDFRIPGLPNAMSHSSSDRAVFAFSLFDFRYLDRSGQVAMYVISTVPT